MEVPTRAELRKLKVVELRQRLVKASLPQGGVKEDLITRLLSHYESVAECEKEATLDEEEAEEDREEVEEGVKEAEGTGEEMEEVRGDEERKEGERREELEMGMGRGKEMEEEKEEEMEGTKEVRGEDGRGEEAEEGRGREVEEERGKEMEKERGKEMEKEEIGVVEEERGGVVEEGRGEEVKEVRGEEVEEGRGGVVEEERGGVVEEGRGGVVEEVRGEEVEEGRGEEVEKARGEGMEEERGKEVEEGRGKEVEEGRGKEVEEGRREEVEEMRREEVEMTGDGMEEARGEGIEEERVEEVKEVRREEVKEVRREEVKEVRREPMREEEAGEGARGEVKGGEEAVGKDMEGGEEEAGTQKHEKEEEKGKGKRKKKKKRRRRHNQQEQRMQEGAMRDAENEVEIEYVQEDILRPGDQHYRQFHQIMQAFKIVEPVKKPEVEESPMDVAARSIEAMKKIAQLRQQLEEESDEEEEEKEAPKISKKKLRKLNRLTVAQLKQLVDRPDVVEMHDVTAQDPKLLVHLKSTRNTVCVPRHWCFKRKYLQGKRGIEKPPFDLPDFIKATGVMEMRQALEEKEEQKSLKQKTRERVRPKMGKLTIDYQKLHDAFFKWQTKPKMSIHGDLYYEGKEFETRLKEKKPGDLSDELRRALGMPIGTGKSKFPPPWLVAMQRYGPPPSYPNLKIPGLNAPIPEGCSFGYFVGGWGKPPVDEMGRPLYGDVFGVDLQDVGTAMDEEEIDKSLWGELESEEEEEEEEEEESEEEGEAPKPDEIQAGLVTPVEGLVTPSGLTSIPAGLETPEMIQLRKKKIEEAMEQGGETPALYTVLPEKQASVGGAMMGSSHVYDITAAVPGAVKKASGAVSEGVEVALDPSELDFDTATMTARYEEQLREQQNQLQKEDLSDMVAEHAAKQKKRKRAAAATDSGGKAAKKMKMKEFKF